MSTTHPGGHGTLMGMGDLGTLLVGLAALLTAATSWLSTRPSLRKLHAKADEAVVASTTAAVTVAAIDHSVNQIEPGAPTLRETAEDTHRLVLGLIDMHGIRLDRIDHRLGLPPIDPEE